MTSRIRPAHLSLALLCFLVGLLLVMQLRTQTRLQKSTQVTGAQDQTRVISDLIDANDKLDRQVDTLRVQLARYERADATSSLDSLVSDLNTLKVVNGLVEVVGPGVELRISGQISATDLQDLLNEVRNAGSEGLSLNDQRVIVSSVVVGEGGARAVNGARLSAPYILRAVGQPETMERAVERKGGLVSLLRYNYPAISFLVVKRDRIVLPIYQKKQEFTYSQVAK